jgi:Group II intron, maturase-specific domain
MVAGGTEDQAVQPGGGGNHSLPLPGSGHPFAVDERDARNDRVTRRMNSWRAGCGESRTSGSASGPGKRTGPKGQHRAPARLNVVLVHGTRSDAEAIRDRIGQLLADKLKMTLSAEKTLITHIDDGFDLLGFRIQRKRRGDGRLVVLTYPSKAALAAVCEKIKKATSRGTTSLRLVDVLRVVNPILRGWAAYFRYGVSKKTFSYLGYYAWWRMIH